MGDVRVAVLVDGKKTDTFPSYETNYKVESIECSNGVNEYWNVENWELRISDMSATSTKCTVSFNSKETNETTPVSYTKEELIALNEEYQNVAYENLKTQLLNDTYPVGSIYMSTEDDTVEKVQNKFGGTWVKYAEDMTLIGASSSKAVNTTGGSSSVTLNTSNLPSHTHDVTATGSVSSSFTGSPVATSSAGAHTHGIRMNWGDGSGNIGFSGTAYTYYLKVDQGSTTHSAGDHTHTVTASGSVKSTFTDSKVTSTSTGSGSSFSIQNPYIAVYMYKRTA